MTEEKNVSKPMQLWNNALKAVKGDNTAQLVEEFTAEMTLVAEGLCEDQARLRQGVEELRREDDRLAQKMNSELQAMESAIRDHQRDTDRRMDELQHRLEALEGKAVSRRSRQSSLIQQATVLVAIVCFTWLVVTILKFFQ